MRNSPAVPPSIAANLANAGVREGDRIAIYLPNGVDWIEACFAGLRAGAVIVPISYDAAEGEISVSLDRCRLPHGHYDVRPEGSGRKGLARTSGWSGSR